MVPGAQVHIAVEDGSTKFVFANPPTFWFDSVGPKVSGDFSWCVKQTKITLLHMRLNSDSNISAVAKAMCYSEEPMDDEAKFDEFDIGNEHLELTIQFA